MSRRKLYFFALIIFVVLMALYFYSSSTPKNQSGIKPNDLPLIVKNEESAIDYIKVVAEQAVNDYWAVSDCVIHEADDKGAYFIVEIREKHLDNEECPGHPLTRPLLAMFHLSKNDGAIFWYDVINDKFISFDEYVDGLKNEK